MFRLDVESGGGQVFVEEIMAQSRPSAERAVKWAVEEFRTATIERLGGSRSGRQYFVSDTGDATYRASEEGQAPAQRRGKLRQNINTTRPVWTAFEVAAFWGVDLEVVPYARRLEFGGISSVPRDVRVRTPTGWIFVKAGTVIRIGPRPFLRTTLDQERERITNGMQAILGV